MDTWSEHSEFVKKDSIKILKEYQYKNNILSLYQYFNTLEWEYFCCIKMNDIILTVFSGINTGYDEFELIKLALETLKEGD